MYKTGKPTKNERSKAILTACIITAAAALAFLIAKGVLDPVKLFGVCGFEQRRNMPCPFCGMTRAVGMFVTGNIAGSFKMQPAAAIMCAAITFMWLYSMAKAFGIQVAAVDNIIGKIKPLPAIITAVIILLIGWAISVYNY